ncbi:MAG: hypothetical protein KIT20_04935 [Alphaproteobacteria bacterium]|nr:hypothetical protein [Alphaproteobacteria bacterium]
MQAGSSSIKAVAGAPDVQARQDPSSPLSVSELMERIALAGRQKSLPWSSLAQGDVVLGPGDLAIAAGRTGHGKTALLVNLLAFWLERHPDQTFAFVSYELPPEAVLLRLISIFSRIEGERGWSYQEAKRYIQGEITGHGGAHGELERAIARVARLEQRIRVIYQPDWNIDILSAHLANAAWNCRFGAVLLDYLQVVPPPEAMQEGRERAIGAVSRRLKQLAVALECPLVAGAQVKGEAARLSELPPGRLEDLAVMEAIGKRRPQLHLLEEGGGEQEADLVFGLLNYQADYFAAREEDEAQRLARIENAGAAPFEIAVIKNRHGQLGSAELVLESHTGYIRDPGIFGY